MTIDVARPIEDEAVLCVHFLVMHRLRPCPVDADELVARWRRQVQDGYRLIAVWCDGVPIALAGHRQRENLVYGPFLYVGDLVTDANLCSDGLGNVLVSHLKAEAERLGCAWLVFDMPLLNVPGHRSYYRNGLPTGALRLGMNTKTGVA